MISTHTLTWSVTKDFDFTLNKLKDFNSHAHVERDEKSQELATNFWISTHTLTWSVTAVAVVKRQRRTISTHTLTWSVTFFLCRGFLSFCYFNSHAHVERDFFAMIENRIRFISTHTLTWSVTLWCIIFRRRRPFQLTRSRGAWRNLIILWRKK